MCDRVLRFYLGRVFHEAAVESERCWTYANNLPGPLFWLYPPLHMVVNAVTRSKDAGASSSKPIGTRSRAFPGCGRHVTKYSHVA